MASISPNVKGGKVVSFRIRVFLGRDSKGKQEITQTTWHVPKGMTQSRAQKEVAKYADEWESAQIANLPSEILTFFSDFVHNPAPNGMEQLSAVVDRAGRGAAP